MDCSAFLNWSKEQPQSVEEMAVVFRSLVATVKIQPVLDAPLEAQAVKFIDYMYPLIIKSADTFLNNLASSHVITTAAMKMLGNLIQWCSAKVKLTLVKADLIPQLINTLNPLSLSFTKAVDVHINVMNIITRSLWLTTPDGFASLKINDRNEQQSVHETILKQVIASSEKYICHLCVNRYSIIDGEPSKRFLMLLACLLRISPHHQPTMEFVLHMPVVLTIPSCLTFIKNDGLILSFLIDMITTQREWNKRMGEVRQMGKKVHRMLRMEGIEDVIDEKLQNDQERYGRYIVDKSIELNNLHGINVPEQE
ncbi:hypothetical protein BLNAU_11986 [Blattamonas nauphoetae]|uniref:Uncharacterized protein n=1 Tax=Blattamonas nauphoetae TaxID=2049346 RepID=A0ABQ9XNP0_9EUKA|nr:hypothetical protein BLNAU_11986 [Blattamonas nauphoetae]